MEATLGPKRVLIHVRESKLGTYEQQYTGESGLGNCVLCPRLCTVLCTCSAHLPSSNGPIRKGGRSVGGRGEGRGGGRRERREGRRRGRVERHGRFFFLVNDIPFRAVRLRDVVDRSYRNGRNGALSCRGFY